MWLFIIFKSAKLLINKISMPHVVFMINVTCFNTCTNFEKLFLNTNFPIYMNLCQIKTFSYMIKNLYMVIEKTFFHAHE